MEFVLDVSKWVTPNSGKGEIQLLNNEGYMCCLGQFSEQLGVPMASLKNMNSIINLLDSYLNLKTEIKGIKDLFIVEFEMQHPNLSQKDHQIGQHSDFALKLIAANDDKEIQLLHDRIERVREIIEYHEHSLKVIGKD